jgi:hypothetical protein
LVLCFVLPRQIYDSPTIEAAVKIEFFVRRADARRKGSRSRQLAPELGQPLGKSRPEAEIKLEQIRRFVGA